MLRFEPMTLRPSGPVRLARARISFWLFYRLLSDVLVSSSCSVTINIGFHLHLLPKPYTYFSFRLIEDAAMIFSYAVIVNQTHVTSVQPLFSGTLIRCID